MTRGFPGYFPQKAVSEPAGSFPVYYANQLDEEDGVLRKLLVPVIYLRDGKAVSGFGSETVI